jgi:hypothetical protein
LNAAKASTRRLFHGNEIALGDIYQAVERLADHQSRLGSEVPVGATFLLSPLNYKEVFDCARIARNAGVRHFFVRRILGPPALRPVFSETQLRETGELLAKVRALHGLAFRVAAPWRTVDEPDLNPAAGDFSASRCWQSTFKTVIEPAGDGGNMARMQLCGRYRGGGVGQLLSLPPLGVIRGDGWIDDWRRSFSLYPVSRESLLKTCVSCIDRGFIQMVDRLVGFVAGHSDFRILHLNSPNPGGEECQAQNIA